MNFKRQNDRKYDCFPDEYLRRKSKDLNHGGSKSLSPPIPRARLEPDAHFIWKTLRQIGLSDLIFSALKSKVFYRYYLDVYGEKHKTVLLHATRRSIMLFFG